MNPPEHGERGHEMNVEIVFKLIVMVCQVIRQSSGGQSLEARLADRVMAEVAPMLAGGNRTVRRLPGDRPLLTGGRTGQEGDRS